MGILSRIFGTALSCTGCNDMRFADKERLDALAIVLDLAVENALDENTAKGSGLMDHYHIQQGALETVAGILDEIRKEGSLSCIGCKQPVGATHGQECSIGYLLQDMVTKDDCVPGEY